LEEEVRTDEFAQHSIQETLKTLGVDPLKGLSSTQVLERRGRFGSNEILEQEESLWHRIFRRFWGPIPWMIEAAAFLSAIVQKWEDFAIIMTMLLINAGVDFFQEHRALNALKVLKQHLNVETIVLRSGEFSQVPARDLVPGDMIKLKIGDIVPADVQLYQGYANTIVKQSEMLAIVVNTGSHTNFSGMVSLVATAQLEERSHFQKMVIQIGDFLILLTIILIVLVVFVGLFRHEDFLEIARFSLVLTVASIPVALPAVLSVTLAVGALNLARRGAIVSKLTAIEELAGVDVFCSDKTGTLTKNEMHVANPVIFDGHDENELFLLAALASKVENRDPIEIPIFHYIEDHFPSLDWSVYKQIQFTPFDPIRKQTEAEVEWEGKRFTALKGAPQVLLEMANLSASEASRITDAIDQLAMKGFRSIAVGRKEGEQLTLVGLIPLFDPPRDDAIRAIEDMRAHGIQVKMVTGDNISIAQEVGRMLGLQGRAILPAELKSVGHEDLYILAKVVSEGIYRRLAPDISEEAVEQLTREIILELEKSFETEKMTAGLIRSHESAIIQTIEAVDIFAQVAPEDKYYLVDALQKANYIVGMTGDGVNDAPALKKADCGIAVSNATDAARAAADIILTSPGLSVINDAIKQARITFERMQSYSLFRIAETMRIILFIALSIIIFDFYPVTATMIIILALLNDIPIMAIAFDNTKVDKTPVRWNMKETLTVSSVLGLAGLASSFLLLYILMHFQFSVLLIQALLFVKLDVAGHSTIYTTRTGDRHFWEKPYPSLALFGAAFSTRIIGTLIAVYGLFMEPIGWTYAMYIWLYATGWFVLNDFIKVAVFRRIRSLK
jgi:H+-transporting ATPase